jgi:heat shock protein HspQ
MERAEFFSPGRTHDRRAAPDPRASHRRCGAPPLFDFRGVVFDIDPVFANSEEWYESIPEDMRPRRDQPFYHLLAENEEVLRRLCQPAEPDRRQRGRPGRSPSVRNCSRLSRTGAIACAAA